MAFGEYSSLSGSDHTKPARSQVRGDVVNHTIANKTQRTHYSWCEGWWPIRRVVGKQPLSSAVNMTRAEAMRNDSYEVRGTIQKHRPDSTPCVPLLSRTFSCVPFSGHTLCAVPRPQVFSLAHVLLCTANWLSKLVLPMYRPLCFWLAGIALEDCHGCPSSECGDMLLLHPCVLASIRQRQPQSFGEDRNGTRTHVLNTAGSQYPRLMRQFALYDASL